MRNRVEWIDAAKGLGIFLVVLGHTLPPNGLAPIIIWAFHMPLFFFLSGLTAKSWSCESAPAIVRGLRSLIVPYLFFSLVSIMFWMTLKSTESASETWDDQLLQMIYGVAGPERKMSYNVALWFFTCLFSVRLVFIMLSVHVKSHLKIIACVLAIALFAHLYIFPNFYSIVWNADVALVALVFFVSGYVVQEQLLIAKPINKRIWWVLGALAMCIFATSIAENGRVDMNWRDFANPIWFYLGAFAGIFLIVAAAKRLENFSYLKTLGHASIVIFPLHLLFEMLPHRAFSIMKWYAYRLVPSEFFASVLVSIAEIMVCLPVYFAIIKWAPFLVGQSKRTRSRFPASISIDKKRI